MLHHGQAQHEGCRRGRRATCFHRAWPALRRARPCQCRCHLRSRAQASGAHSVGLFLWPRRDRKALLAED
eukprot:3892635-Alexandrium_andersonii.AAC.1